MKKGGKKMQTVATAKPQARLRGEGLTEWLVISLVILALIAGWVLKVFIQGQTATFASEALSVRYPVDWLLGKDEETLFAVTDPDSLSTFKTTFSARVEALGEVEEKEYIFKVEGVDASVKPLGQVTGLNAAANRLIMRRNKELKEYNVLSARATTLMGLEALAIEYAYVDSPRAGWATGASLPVVVQAVDTVTVKGDQVYVFTYAADADILAQEKDTLTAILESVSLK
jgi:hypothetical protein